MKIFLVGPTLLGVAHFAGSFLVDDVRQVVHERPTVVYANVSSALSATPKSGMMELDGGKPVPYRLSVDRGPGEHLVVHLMLDDRKAGQIDLTFTPENGGGNTLIIAKVESDGKVVREELAGTDKAKLGYAPDWLLNFAFGKALREAAAEIEKGSFTLPAGGFAGGGEAMTVEQQKQHDQWRQYQATQPSVDPNAAADAYMGRSE